MTPDDMTPRDRRRALVRRSLMAAPRLSDRLHARHLGVSRELVAKTRRTLVSEGLDQPYPRTGRDGKTYRLVPQPVRPKPRSQNSTRLKSKPGIAPCGPR